METTKANLKKLRLIDQLDLEPEELEEGTVGEYVLSPLPRGMGTTLGNALRRVLLSSIKGDAITYVKIEGLFHEFSPMPGIMQDSTELLLNLRSIPVRLDGDVTSSNLELEIEGKGDVTAADFEDNSEVEILNPEDHFLCEITDEEGSLELEATVTRGVGYVPAEENESDEQAIGVLTLDADYSPVERVTFDVEKTRVGSDTDLDELHLTVVTNGLRTPDQVFNEASDFLEQYFTALKDELMEKGEVHEVTTPTEEESDEDLDVPITEIGLGKRAENCLLGEGIETLADLVEKTPEQLLEIRSFGEKSLIEVVDKLAEHDLYLKEEAS